MTTTALREPLKNLRKAVVQRFLGGLSLAVMALALAACGPKPSQEVALPRVLVSEVQADGGQSFVLAATYRPRYETDVAFRASGKVSERKVEVGQQVSAGQLLARVEATDYRLLEAQAQAQLRQAEFDQQQALSDEARFEQLLKDGAVGVADNERQRLRADTSRARRDQAAQQLQLSRNRTGYTDLLAPYAGVITQIRFEQGQVVSEGQPVISLAKTGEAEWVAEVPETWVGRVRALKAEASFTHAPQTRFALRLRELSPMASAAGRSYRARFSVVGASGANQMWGMSGELVLSEPNAAKALVRVPAAAVWQREGQQSYVWKLDPAQSTVSAEAVEVVRYEQDFVVLKGLALGTTVVSAGGQKLKAGNKVVATKRSHSGLNDRS